MISFDKLSRIIGGLLLVFSGFMLIPLIIDITFKNTIGSCGFALAFVATLFVAGFLFLSSQPQDDWQLNFREKVILIIVGWCVLSVTSALPLILSSTNISMIDGLFEMISAFSTSGASIILNIKEISEGMIFWRSFLQLLGCIFFIISNMYMFADFSSLIFPNLALNNDRNVLFSISKITFNVYFGISFLAALILISAENLSPLDAFCYTFAAISSGGLTSQSTYAFNGNVLNITMTSLMFISGLSVSVFRKIINVDKTLFVDTQLRCYIGTIFIITFILIAFSGNVSSKNLLNEIQNTLFNVISAITTSGISMDITSGKFCNSFMYLLSFLGGCFGSGTGGVKILRIIIVITLLKCYLSRIINSNSIYIPTYNGQKIEKNHLGSLFSYFMCYLGLAIFLTCVLSYSYFDFTKSFGAIITSMNNNGVYFGLTKASALELATLSYTGKISIILAMIAGRLEFVPFFIVMMKSFWKRGK